MTYTPLPNPWTGIPLVGSLIDAIQNQLASTTSPITGSSLTIGDTTQGNEHIDPTNGYREFYMAEAYPRVQLSRDGYSSGVAALGFGPGNVAPDTKLYRSSAGNLKTDGSFYAGQSLIVDHSDGGNRLYFGSALDTYLYRGAANRLMTDDLFGTTIGGRHVYIGNAYTSANGWMGGYFGASIFWDGTNWQNQTAGGNNGWAMWGTAGAAGGIDFFTDAASGAVDRTYTPAQMQARKLFSISNTGIITASSHLYFPFSSGVYSKDSGGTYRQLLMADQGASNVVQIARDSGWSYIELGYGAIIGGLQASGNWAWNIQPNLGGTGATGFLLFNASGVETARYYTDGSNLIIKATGGTMQLSDSAGGGGIYAGGMRVHRHPYGNDRHIESGGYLWGGGGSISVTFTSAYAAAPIVVIGGEGEALYAQSITTTGFTFGAGSSGHSYWLAEGN